MAANIAPRVARIAGSASTDKSRPNGTSASAGTISSSRMTASTMRHAPAVPMPPDDRTRVQSATPRLGRVGPEGIEPSTEGL